MRDPFKQILKTHLSNWSNSDFSLLDILFILITVDRKIWFYQILPSGTELPAHASEVQDCTEIFQPHELPQPFHVTHSNSPAASNQNAPASQNAPGLQSGHALRTYCSDFVRNQVYSLISVHQVVLSSVFLTCERFCWLIVLLSVSILSAFLVSHFFFYFPLRCLAFMPAS